MAEATRASAEASQARNPNPAWSDVLRAGHRSGALGPVVAHTGSAIGLLLAPGTPAQPVAQSLGAVGLEGVFAFAP